MNIALHLNLNPRLKRYQQLFCRHSWPQLNFAVGEYRTTCTCGRCGKTKHVFIADQPGFATVLPTDYYGNSFRQQ
ncbi:hypothetical protein C8P68_102533 [Mucilaginibacter yixingensis]|uniref:Uncharacterized protein n=1 Tax=Mucilaginibacter yixingensis TaxID=1295612 RepID=A0A2T5JD69_9SPHI|nr:hypothetical protein [Mucilaginibacter yixingensis]PTQ99704.1 hypothetical protein C8P68_102533 [Mucilaginibacter yixingensis]